MDLQDVYLNEFGIDYHKIHKSRAISTNIPDNLNLKFNFEDGISKSFKICIVNGLVYLVGDQSAYPCIGFIRTVDDILILWVIVIPRAGRRLQIINTNNNNLNIQIEYYNRYLNAIKPSKLIDFLNSYKSCLELLSNYSDHFLKRIIVSNIHLTIPEIYYLLKEFRLLNPLERSIAYLVFEDEFDSDEVYELVFKSLRQNLYLEYISRRKSTIKLNLSDSTLAILKSNSIKDKFSELYKAEIEEFLEIKFLKDRIVYVEGERLILNILGVKNYDRWLDYSKSKAIDQCTNPRLGITEYYVEIFNSFGLTEVVLKEYYKKLKSNIRNLENSLRWFEGYSIVGSLFNESLLFNLLKEKYKKYEIISQYSPSWLGRQRIDIYIKELNLAIEYNGIQHYQPVNFYGGQKGFDATKKRDAIKRDLCIKNGVKLLDVKYDQDLVSFVEKLDY